MASERAPDLPPAATGPGPWQCAADPTVETYLRCGRCERPICPRCLVQTPVGAKCRDCAQLRKPPMFDIKPMGYVRAVGAAIGAGIGAAAVLILVQGMVPFFGFFGLLFMAGFGYVVGEAVSLAVRRKQGNQLGVIAAAGVFLGLIVVRAALFMFSGAPPVLAFAGAFASVFGSLWGMLGILLAAGIAFSRAR